MSYDKEISTVRVACEVSFKVGHMDYGTILVPAGTQVFRHKVNGKVSDWWVAHDDMVKLCPESYKINGQPSTFYLHDASHYGISLPNANICPIAGDAKAKHNAHHY